MILINAILEDSLASTTKEDDEEAGGMTKEERAQVIDDGYLADDELEEEEEERKETIRRPECVCQKGCDWDGGSFGGETRLPWDRTSRVLRGRGKCVPGTVRNLITNVFKLRIRKPPPPPPPSQPPPMKPKKRPAKNVPILVRASNIPNRPIRY